MGDVFLVLVLAHLIGDFVIQIKYVNINKKLITRFLYSKGLIYHSVHHAILTLLLLTFLLEWDPIYLPIGIMIFIVHYFIDFGKIKLETCIIPKLQEKYTEEKYLLHYIFEKKTTYFILDQMLHIVSIYIILLVFQFNPMSGNLVLLFSTDGQVIGNTTKLIILGILFILVTFASAHFIATLMSDLSRQKIDNDEIAATIDLDDLYIGQLKEKVQLAKTDLVINEMYRSRDKDYTLQVQYQRYNNSDEGSKGIYIGILERILITIFIVHHLFAGLALLIAVKTLTRFKRFEDRNFAEYYLVGTLLSLVIGLMLAFTIDKMIKS